MKLEKDEKNFKRDLMKISKGYKDKSRLMHIIDLLVDKDIKPSCIDIKQIYKADNGFEMSYDVIVYKDNLKRSNDNIILVVKFVDDILDEKNITNISYNYFSSMPNLFFILFYNNNKKFALTFKTLDDNKILINKTNELPSFKWT
ncbi:hypothetical protein [Malacoplasma muris]|uniref:hypothetical protein n=1 Tax=Malacoplasma muris TaxID=2119 RepID=UPI00398E9841